MKHLFMQKKKKGGKEAVCARPLSLAAGWMSSRQDRERLLQRSPTRDTRSEGGRGQRRGQSRDRELNQRGAASEGEGTSQHWGVGGGLCRDASRREAVYHNALV